MELITVGKLTESQYFKWKNGILSSQLAGEKSKVTTLQLELLKKDLEVLRLKTAAYSQVCATAESHFQNAKDEYSKLRIALEKEVGVSLTDVVIDEVTFEIKKEELNNGTSSIT